MHKLWNDCGSWGGEGFKIFVMKVFEVGFKLLKSFSYLQNCVYAYNSSSYYSFYFVVKQFQE